MTTEVETLGTAPLYLRPSEQEVLERGLEELAEDVMLTEPWLATAARELLWAIQDGRTLVTTRTRGDG